MTSLWIKKLARYFLEKDVVKSVKTIKNDILVRYNTGISILYTQKETKKFKLTDKIIISKSDFDKASDIHIYYESLNIVNNTEEYPIILKSDIKKSNEVDKSIAIQRFIYSIIYSRTFIQKYSHDDMVKSYDLIKTKKVNYSKLGNLKSFIEKGDKAKAIIYTYYDIMKHKRNNYRKSLYDIYNNPKYILFYVNKMLKSTNKDLSIKNYNEYLNTMKIGPRIIDPQVYREIILQLIKPKLDDTIYDIYPNFGEKYLACASCGIKYCPIYIDGSIQIPDGLIKFTKHSTISDTLPCKILIADNTIKPIKVSDAINLKRYCDRLVITSKEKDYNKYKGMFTIVKSMKINTALNPHSKLLMIMLE